MSDAPLRSFCTLKTPEPCHKYLSSNIEEIGLFNVTFYSSRYTILYFQGTVLALWNPQNIYGNDNHKQLHSLNCFPMKKWQLRLNMCDNWYSFELHDHHCTIPAGGFAGQVDTIYCLERVAWHSTSRKRETFGTEKNRKWQQFLWCFPVKQFSFPSHDGTDDGWSTQLYAMLLSISE